MKKEKTALPEWLQERFAVRDRQGKGDPRPKILRQITRQNH